MKKILILGAGIYQVPLIKRAKELGLYVIVCSRKGNYPGFKYADKVYYVNTTDKYKILKISEKEGISAITTTGTDVAVRSIGYVCEKMGLSGVGTDTSRLCTNKYLMKVALEKGAVSTAKFYKVHNYEEAKKACEQIGYPVISKCVDSSGSRGIAKIENEDGVKKAIAESFQYTSKKYILIEKFISGIEICVDGYVDDNGEFGLVLPNDKICINNGKTNLSIGHYFPYECNEKLNERIISEAKKAVNSLNMRNSFFDMDLIISNGVPYIVEVGSRVGASCIPELISIHCEYDYYKMIIDVALGNMVQWDSKKRNPCGSSLIFYDKAVLLKKELKSYEEEDIVVQYDYFKGDTIPKFENATSRIGHIICKGKNKETVELSLKKTLDRIIAELDRQQ